MGPIAISSLCVGAALGLRFRVLALLPAIFLEFIVLTTLGIALGQDGGWIVLANLAGVGCLQVGYVGGTFPRFLFVASRLAAQAEPLPGRWLLNKR
jgi:hypothetical protein